MVFSIRSRYLYILTSFLVLGGLSFLLVAKSNSITSTKKIISPQDAAQQAQKLTPEQLTKIEVDGEIRDKLRFDPAWQEIATAIRQDIMQMKWGTDKLENPAWKRYGAKAFPLFDYYARSQDPIRQRYGVLGIRSLGKPYTTLWLTGHLQRKLSTPDISLLQTPLNTLENGIEAATITDDKTWQKEFGLDDKATRLQIVKLAKQYSPPANYNYNFDWRNPYHFSETTLFSSDFLTAVGVDIKAPYKEEPPNPQKLKAIAQWTKFDKLKKPSPSDIKNAVTFFNNQTTDIQEYLLEEPLGQTLAGKITDAGRAVLLSLATSASKEQVWAIAELDRHNDAKGKVLLENVLNGDLKKIHPLTKLVQYGYSGSRGGHAYNLLIAFANKYPQSKFIKGCREYGDLVGASYFDREPRSLTILQRNTKKTLSQQAQDWQKWLQRYPDHPGADDATYRLARILQAQNDIMGAMHLYTKLMMQPMGDGDALYMGYPHVRSLLDVGLTTDQIEALIKEPENKPMVPLLQYAASVRYARIQNYARALEISEKLDVTTMPKQVLGSYYYNYYWREEKPEDIQKQIQATLTKQRQRWQNLLTLQQKNTPESQYQIAANWYGKNGWENGYMGIWDGYRAEHLPMEECDTWWVCNTKLRDINTVRKMYEEGSQNGVALSLLKQVVDNPNTAAQLREKALYMQTKVLFEQWEYHPFRETIRIHPAAGIVGKAQKYFLENNYNSNLATYEAATKVIKQDYQRRIDEIISQLQLKFPQSTYIDDLLFNNYFFSSNPEYLQRIVRLYPKGDRAESAKYILEHRQLKK
jgi:hypothetical protein